MISFNNFSPQSFERLVQALSTRILGPGLVVFGAGPDGAREATFEGTVPFPSTENKWGGYIVVQAKCREAIKGDARDAAWLNVQLKQEFEKFVKNRNLRRPEYYILATNVTLSPEPTNGGRAKVEKTINQYKKRLKIKEVALLSADELRVHLENARDIRLTYAAWLTPSDILAGLLDHIAKPHLKQILPLALARDLRQERDVRLREAGQETEKPIYLDDLFVDLPFTTPTITDEAPEETSGEENDERDDDVNPRGEIEVEEHSTHVVAQLLRRSADKMDSESIACHARLRKGRLGEPQPNRLVILGGPGQGKSTLGQFLAQVSRARLLAQHANSALNPQTADLIAPILERARLEGLPLHGPARFPIRIDLPIYADALQKAGPAGLSLIAFAAERLSRNVDQSISPAELRIWFGSCPALIILDGLDEVPPSGNRIELIKSIDALWDDLSLVQADVLAVVTTRPQGYNDDLSARYWQHWELSPLTSDDAMRFAERLAQVRLSDLDRRNVVLSELNRAAADASTMLLLGSPLQVTIMFGISLLKGAIPQDRWELFERYYTLLRDREAQKTGADAKVIRDFKRQIDAIHYQAGFILHVISESAGGANAHLSLLQFCSMISRLLVEEGHSDEDVTKISSELVRIATERLVLLNCRVEGQIAFDVRSLQEFMAAAQIAAFSSAIVIQRLRTIALSTHWQHVFRIAASKIFSVAELGPLRSEVIGICHAVDNGDLGEDGRLVRAGAKLALELLEDGIAHTAPAFRRNLIRRALAQLDVGPEILDVRLASHCGADTRKVFEEELVSRIVQGETLAARSAWILLSRLLETDREFAESVMLANWPKSPQSVLSLVDILHGKWPSNLIHKVKEAQAAAGPRAAAEFADDHYGGPNDDEANQIDPFLVLPDGMRSRAAFARAQFSVRDNSGKQIIEVGLIRLDECSSFIVDDDLQRRPNWASHAALASFLSNPSKRALAEMLRRLASDGCEGLPKQGLPWVCISVLREHDEGTGLETLAREADAGLFGDERDWSRAEARWFEYGVRPHDFEQWSSGRYLQANIGELGISYPQPIVRSPSDRGDLTDLLAVSSAIKATGKRLRYFEILSNSVDQPGRNVLQRPRLLDELCRPAIEAANEVGSPRNVRLINYLAAMEVCWELPEFLDLANEAGAHSRVATVRRAEPTILAFNSDPSRRGLLSFLGGRARRHPRELLLKLDDSAFSPHTEDNETVRQSVARLRLHSGNWRVEHIDTILRDIKDRLDGTIHLSSVADHPRYPMLLRAACSFAFTPQRLSRRSFIRTPVQLLARIAGSQPSDLGLASTRAGLDLPDLPSAE